MAAREKPIARPMLACEVSASHIIAARAGKGASGIELVSARTLPAGSVTPGLSGTNVPDIHGVRLAISEALNAVRGRSRDVVAILPDAAVRVVLLDFDTLPEKQQEAAAVVRFRLKKSLPFNVEDAALSFDWHRSEEGYRVVAAVVPRHVLDEYESAFRDAGYVPGVVLPSIIAALGAVEADRPILVIKLDGGSTSVAIADRNELRLVRTLENPNGADVTAAAEHIAADLYPSMVFFEDTYSAKIERILLAGLPSVTQVASALQAQTGLPVQVLDSSHHLDPNIASGSTPPSLLAGVVGALLG
jgi:type IV pilus assembly protein PilM